MPCGVEVEVLQKISDPHLVDCAACGKPTMKKKVTAAAFRLSGAGWYETDFKDDNKKNLTDTSDASNKSGDEKKKASSDSSTTETKSSASTTTKESKSTSSASTKD